MQIDMHYYGTYAMARSAGLNEQACQAIATAAEFVDDNPGKTAIEFKDAARLDLNATAHHALDISNLDPEDQRHVWVPFHFFPGGEGDSYTERLVCVKDGKLARAMVEHNLGQSAQPFALELLGITAHVYADTFSHYGFSGVSSRRNRIVSDSLEFGGGLDPDIVDHIRKKAKDFEKKYGKENGLIANIKESFAWFTTIKAKLGGVPALGHGAVATFPDRPYLVWSFEYEHVGNRVHRNNPETFLEGCEALHRMFSDFGKRRPEMVEDGIGKSFEKIRQRVQGILLKPGKKSERVEYWQKAMRAGELSNEVGHQIPVYHGKEWHEQLDALDKTEDSQAILSLAPFRFFQAVAAHKAYVMRDLLPAHGIIVD